METHATGAIEGFAIEPIPAELKTVRWPDLFLLVSNFLINPSTILIGGLAVASGLSFWATVLSSTLGIVVAFAASALAVALILRLSAETGRVTLDPEAWKSSNGEDAK